jgi:hypothetical protein
LGVAALAVAISAEALPAQSLLEKEWAAVPPRESGLVLIIENHVSEVSLKGPKENVLNTAEWHPEVPFIRQYRVTPGKYEIRASLPISAVNVDVKPGRLTYVKFSPYQDDNGHVGVYITGWVGPVPERVEELLSRAKALGITGVYDTPRIETHAKILEVSTSPPWTIPPRPRPSPQPPPPSPEGK